MKNIQLLQLMLILFFSATLFSQEEVHQDILYARESLNETKLDKIEENSLAIKYKGQSFSFGDSFESVNQKIGKGAEYAGKFNLELEGVGFYDGTADYMIRYKDADFYFENGQFAYFEIMSKSFPVKLRANNGNNGVVNLRVGQSVNVMKNLFKNPFAEKGTEGDAYRDVFAINVGDLYADSPIANDLLIMVEKGTDKISIIAFYGY